MNVQTEAEPSNAMDGSIDPYATTLEQVRQRMNLAKKVLETIQRQNISEPRTGPTFTIAQAAELIGRTTSAIRVAESDGRLPEQPRNDFGRRENYTLEQLHRMRDVFGTQPHRAPDDEPLIIPFQNFKGGVGKSTLAIHAAQYLAMRGYRVLLIDADAQASTTMMFGYIPDQEIDMADSLYPVVLRGDKETYRPIAEVIRKTHYHGLDLIPANLHLYNAEYEIASRLPAYGASYLTGLKQEIASVSHNYDVVIIDPPPALGMISLSVLYAANALVIPMPPNIIDFASTTSFLSMLENNMRTLAEQNVYADYKFIQLVISRGDESRTAHREIVDLTNMVFGRTVMTTEIKTSAEFDNSSARQQSVYDMASTTTNHKVRKRCLDQLNHLNSEIEQMIRSQWKGR